MITIDSGDMIRLGITIAVANFVGACVTLPVVYALYRLITRRMQRVMVATMQSIATNAVPADLPRLTQQR